MERIMRWMTAKRIQISAAFLMPVVLMLVCYAVEGIYPFGDRTVYTWDLEGQYSSFMNLLHHMLTGKASWAYSLSGGLGGSTLGLIAYYLSSPFHIIMFFFDELTMPIGIMALILMKTACMGGFMFLYLQYKKESPLALLFSTSYAMSAYVIVHQSNIMWLDAVVFLPLIILGLEKLLKEKKCLLYILSLGLAIISNYYTGYMLCLFSLLYFGLYMICLSKGQKRGGIFLRYAFSSLCSGGLAAFLLIPVALELQQSANKLFRGTSVLGNWTKIYYYRSTLPMFLPCSYDDIQRWEVWNGSFPLLYCGILIIFGVFLFLFSQNITLREKIFGIGLLGCIFVSFNRMNLFLLWHGLYSPLGAPWRYAFLWSFAVLAVAYQGTVAVLESDKKSEKVLIRGKGLETIWLAVGCEAMYFIWVLWRFESYRRVALFGLVIATAEAAGLLLWKNRKNDKKRECPVTRMLALSICILALGIELCGNAVYIWSQGYQFEPYMDYANYVESVGKCIAGSEDKPYRSEFFGQAVRSRNTGFLWNENTITMYSSTEKEKVWDVLYRYGFGDGGENYSFGGGSTLFAKNMIGLKYLYSDEGTYYGYEKKPVPGSGIYVFENKNSLPLGFLVKESAVSITDIEPQEDLFTFQNRLFEALSGCEDVCEDSTENQTGGPYRKVPEDEWPGLGLSGVLQDILESRVIASVKDGYYTDGVSIYEEDADRIEEVMEKTAQSVVETEMRSDSDIRTKVNNSLNQMAYVCYSVPYDTGWKATVDGNGVETMQGMGGFLLVPVETGVHEVRIVYHPPGSAAGGIISLASLLGLAGYCYIRRKRQS